MMAMTKGRKEDMKGEVVSRRESTNDSQEGDKEENMEP